ncbi:hypothetical protein JD844_027430 [Phrynosoma platyrhinos]|uniref:Uncharacterized protein n=1 Tax=Phrynosoma platyrhinos TaxID=52577 RepID=A0ABQ7SG88_PHRPL|nr:hypothetical protein JD844_027430 [Phrynosoma platyrhinos]
MHVLVSFLRNCLNHQDEKIVAYCCMVLSTCLNPQRIKELQEEHNLNTVLAILKAYRRHSESEWVFLIVTNHLLKCPELVKAMYAKLSNQERTLLLELILSEIDGNNLDISEEMAKFLSNCFREKCQAVLNLASTVNSDNEEALVIVRLLDVLCEVTSNTGQLQCLQACPDLLEAVVSKYKIHTLKNAMTI